MADYREMISLPMGVDDENDDDDDISFIDPSIPSNTSYSVCIISLYVVRLAQPNDNWKIQILFDNDMKCSFKVKPLFDRPKVRL